jgi:hypothetical protein
MSSDSSSKKSPKRWPYVVFAILTGTSIAIAATNFTGGVQPAQAAPLASASVTSR